MDTLPELDVETAVDIDTSPDDAREDEPVDTETVPVISGLDALLTKTDRLDVVPLAPPRTFREPPVE